MLVQTHRIPPLRPSLAQWNDLIKPSPGQGDSVVLGRRENDPLPQSIQDVRRSVNQLDFHSLDPFVATVGAGIAADQIELPKGETVLELHVPEYYAEGVEVLFGAHHGPGAPLLVILPGIHGSGQGSHCSLFKKIALERGMNYLVLPNSMSPDMLDDKPRFHPGNPRVDALWSHQLLNTFRQSHPDFCSKVSVAGYSYGALQGANLIRLDEEGSERVIDGNFVALSPPENLTHSMLQLDALRDAYRDGSATIVDTGLHYKMDVRKLGYPRFPESGLAQHGPGTNVDEIEISDKYGSRDSLKSLIEIVDRQFGHNQLPKNTEKYAQAGWIEKLQMRQEHAQIVENMTYQQMTADWVSKDLWLKEQGLTPAQLAERYSFTQAMQAVNDTPVLVLASADDYILAASDVQALQALEKSSADLEVVRVLPHGGHVGLDWNPQVAETMVDFAAAILSA